MLIGIGTDIVSIKRIKNVLNKHCDRFTKRILTEREHMYFINSNKSINFLAKRFAGKEAFAKATGYGIGKIVSFHDIEIENEISGKPIVKLSDRLKNILKYDELSLNIHISLSDEINYVIAMIVIELN